MVERWQLLDRPDESLTVREALTSDDAGGIVLVGDAGVGKTTLARMVTAELAAPVRWAVCTESSQAIPLGAFAPWIDGSASRDPLALLTEARKNLIAGEAPVIGVDDAHLLDQLSATLLHQIAAERSARIIATVRSGESVPGAVLSLWKDDYLDRLELAPMRKGQCVRLVESVLAGTLEGLSADVIWESSGGNPLFLRNMVEGAMEAGNLTEVEGVWQLRGPTAVPSGLVELLHERLQRTGDAVLEALRTLALYEPLDLDILTALADPAAVDAAELAGLIRISTDTPPTARFSHPLLGEVVRRQLGTAAARAGCGRIVDALRDRPLDTAASRIRLARLCVDSDRPIDPDVLITAAKDAVALANLPLGERLARAAHERGGGLRAAELLSRALLWQGRPQAADEILAGYDPEQLDQLQIVQWGVPRASLRFWSLGDVASARRLIELMGTGAEHPALRLIVDAAGAAMAVHENRIAEGIAAAEAVLEAPDAPRQAVDFAAFAAGLAMPVAGRGLDFGPIAARSRAQQKATDGMIRVMVRYCDVLALTTVGELDRAEQRAAEYSEFFSAGQFLGWAIAKIAVGVVATARGRFREAITAFEQALAALNAETSLPWQLPARLLLVRAYAALGDTEKVEKTLRDAAEHAGPHLALHEPQRMLARAWAAAPQNSATAAELARRAARIARGAGQFALEAEALHHAARFGDGTGAARLAELAPKVQGAVVALYARHADAVATGGAADLDAVSADFETAGLLLSAADAAAQAVPIHDRAGQRGPSARCTARAAELSSRCDGATTPAITAASHPLPITPREREIAAHIAQGLSNKEIAERLVVSVRTVEGHIYRASIKLDVDDREKLADVVWPGVRR
ncbi:helix-turn-helix transcriptional regulator [Nocardia asteroides]|uniref:helix-turn-helix transcriptional regulator n=1 Tax=Nocardia asteroides TaxID=1824 RepID=UPI001E3008FF|nr:LuxR C-terminal-related transcriptional regulator [Nocardia asteroides]UGT61045.1 LuxR C-terminal-related transcriptional regulator [Nocardia asteroides]